MDKTSFGIVAEKSSVFLSFGVWSIIASSSSLNPIFNISSASSNTTVSTFEISILFLFIKSTNLPGVAETI